MQWAAKQIIHGQLRYVLSLCLGRPWSRHNTLDFFLVEKHIGAFKKFQKNLVGPLSFTPCNRSPTLRFKNLSARLSLDTFSNSMALFSYGACPTTSRIKSRMNLPCLVCFPFVRAGLNLWVLSLFVLLTRILIVRWPFCRPTAISYRGAILQKARYKLSNTNQKTSRLFWRNILRATRWLWWNRADDLQALFTTQPR